MSNFVNTVSVLGDEATIDSIIEGTIEEFKDDMLTSLGTPGFRACTKLKLVDLPKLVSIATYCFYDCSVLKTLILRSNTMCTLATKEALSNTPIKSGTGYIYVPRAMVDSYKSATNWSTYAAQIRAIEDYPEITGG